MDPRSLAAALGGAALLTSLLALTPTAGAGEPTSTSPVALSAPERVTAYAYGNRVYTDFGLRLLAGDAPFEIHAKRPSWDDPITAWWIREGHEPTALPAGSMTAFSGLDGLVEVTLTRVSDGSVVRETSIDSCLNSWSSTRTRPDAPGRSPYPTSCPWNPFTVGSVQGIQAGWSSSVLGEYGSATRLAVGRYDVTASIDPELATFFGIAPQDAVAQTRLVVRQGEEGMRRPQRQPRPGTTLQPSAEQEPASAAAGAPPADLLPDLQSLPAFDISLNRRGTALRFAANVWNGGGGPLVIDGFREAGDDSMDAYQYFYDAEGNEVPDTYQRVGEFHFHGDDHQHWHFEDFAGYRLLEDDGGAPGALAVRSTKASFCLANTDAVDYTVPNADWQPDNTDLSSACGGPEAQGLREVLSNGSGDTYHQYRAGQAFRVRNLPDGWYWIAVEANPDDAVNGRNLIEGDLTNNDSYRRVKLLTRKGQRMVKVPQVGIIDETMPRFY